MNQLIYTKPKKITNPHFKDLRVCFFSHSSFVGVQKGKLRLLLLLLGGLLSFITAVRYLRDLRCESELGVITEDSATSSHTSSPQRFALYAEPAFNISANWRTSWTVPRPCSGPGVTRSLPPHTWEGKGGRKGKKRGEYEAGSERDGANQKQMLVHVWFSIANLSRVEAQRIPPASTFHTVGVTASYFRWMCSHFSFLG